MPCAFIAILLKLTFCNPKIGGPLQRHTARGICLHLLTTTVKWERTKQAVQVPN